jgi:hypothetical protein
VAKRVALVADRDVWQAVREADVLEREVLQPWKRDISEIRLAFVSDRDVEHPP